MSTVTARYLGDLRIECIHNASGTAIITDAPVDNRGKGEAFSPTDLCATALGTCAMTIMGIYARDKGIDLTGARIEINKIMSASPRRIARVEVEFHMPDRSYTSEQKAAVEASMKGCPVCLSLNPAIEQKISFHWAD